MRSWSDKLHTATQALLTAVTDLHNKTHDAILLRLVTSVTDIVYLAEQLNADHRRLERELQKEQQTSQRIVARIDALERLHRPFGRTTSTIPSKRGEQQSGDAPVGSDGRVGENTAPKKEFPQRHPTQNLKKLEDKAKELEVTPLLTPPQTPPPPASLPQQASISPYKPTPPKHLPPLPTLQEVEAEQRQRRSKKRALASQTPPPCDKCCVRKRAMMLREHGYVKEDVFLRWSKRPGGCIAFMHYDEPLPEGSRNDLSFKETETESPDT